MSTEIIAALIAFGGVVISVVVSILTSSRQTASELTKLRTEIQQSYADKLLERRLDIYPDTYDLLSAFAKKLELKKIKKSDISELLNKINKLDSKSSILFSGHTGYIAFRFRQYFIKLLQQDDEDIMSIDVLQEIKARVGEFELALKSDLGIYVVEFSDPAKRFSSYGELDQAVIGAEKRSSLKSTRYN